MLFKVFGFEVRSYGLLLMLGLVAAVLWARARAAKWDIAPDKVLDASFWGIIPGILGARIGFIAQEWDYYSSHTSELWSLRFEGLTSFGGVFGALIGLAFFTKRAKISTMAFLDVCAVPLLLAHAVGRLGCLLNGCCYGRGTQAWYGVNVHFVEGLFTPAQVFDSAYVMLGALVILWFEKTRRPAGQSFALAVFMWGLARFVYEFSRAGTVDEVNKGIASSTYWGTYPVTEAQVAALVMVAVGALMYFLAGRRQQPLEQSNG